MYSNVFIIYELSSASFVNRFFIFVFSATAILFDWIKFDVWNQVVLQSSYSRASLARQQHDVWNSPDSLLQKDRRRSSIVVATLGP